ncbi:Sir2 family NAD+-dependent deacetylase [Algicola sagamiensis]|uniref:Sir2 family NAD+-dependent deacetylase n=1 Tax=Algicola sagamiensis TaxID=163869 RepID=UPI00036B474E|nr:Sir2 family NAD+-dependent deacetylase [Algicola sagamiensis]
MKIVVLTGAGISAESGIQTFRASDGLWENHRIEDVATPEGFMKNPNLVYQFYNERRRQLLSPGISPNPAHIALAELEKQGKHEVLVVTQNIDDLHERAGTQNIIHMHGELLLSRCEVSGITHEARQDVTEEDECPCCTPGARLRPHVVWFGEMPLEMERIYEALSDCDLFLSIGTSGNVYPAAGFVAEAKAYGARAVEINLEASMTATQFDEHIYGPAGTVLSEFLMTLP